MAFGTYHSTDGAGRLWAFLTI